MKKKFLTIAMVLCLACVLVFSIACLKNEEVIPVESIELDVNEITLENGEEYTLNYTVIPSNGKICFSFDDTLLEYTVVSDGAVKIKTRGSGTGNFRISSAKDSNIYEDCKVTVALPQGYSQYKNTNYGVKFVYPSTWKSENMPSSKAYYSSSNGLSNMNLIVEDKTNVYFTATADYYRRLIIDMYKTLGYTVVFSKCEIKKYDNDTAVQVTMDYTLNMSLVSLSVHQEQFIKNSSSKTCGLTLTFASEYKDIDNDLINTVRNEFVTW